MFASVSVSKTVSYWLQCKQCRGGKMWKFRQCKPMEEIFLKNSTISQTKIWYLIKREMRYEKYMQTYLGCKKHRELLSALLFICIFDTHVRHKRGEGSSSVMQIIYVLCTMHILRFARKTANEIQIKCVSAASRTPNKLNGVLFFLFQIAEIRKMCILVKSIEWNCYWNPIKSNWQLHFLGGKPEEKKRDPESEMIQHQCFRFSSSTKFASRKWSEKENSDRTAGRWYLSCISISVYMKNLWIFSLDALPMSHTRAYRTIRDESRKKQQHRTNSSTKREEGKKRTRFKMKWIRQFHQICNFLDTVSSQECQWAFFPRIHIRCNTIGIHSKVHKLTSSLPASASMRRLPCNQRTMHYLHPFSVTSFWSVVLLTLFTPLKPHRNIYYFCFYSPPIRLLASYE